MYYACELPRPMVSGLGSQSRCCHQTPVYGIRVCCACWTDWLIAAITLMIHQIHQSLCTINGSRMVRMDKDRALTGGWALDLTDC